MRFRGPAYSVERYDLDHKRFFCPDTKQLMVSCNVDSLGTRTSIPEIQPGKAESILNYLSDEHSINRALCGFMTSKGWRINAVWDGAHRYVMLQHVFSPKRFRVQDLK